MQCRVASTHYGNGKQLKLKWINEWDGCGVVAMLMFKDFSRSFLFVKGFRHLFNLHTSPSFLNNWSEWATATAQRNDTLIWFRIYSTNHLHPFSFTTSVGLRHRIVFALRFAPQMELFRVFDRIECEGEKNVSENWDAHWAVVNFISCFFYYLITLCVFVVRFNAPDHMCDCECVCRCQLVSDSNPETTWNNWRHCYLWAKYGK